MTMTAYRILIAFFFLCQISCSDRSGSGQDFDSSEREVHQFLEIYYQTFSNRDWLEFRELFVDNAILTTVWQEDSASSPAIHTNTISEFLAQTKEGPDSQPVFEERMVSAKISVKQNLAQAWVEYDAKFGSKESIQEWSGYDLISLIRFDGQWKIVSIVFEAK
jgi:hypothetical protein